MKLHFYVSVMCVAAGLAGQIENTYADDVNDFKPVYKLRTDNECWPTSPANGANSGECVTRSEYQATNVPVFWETYEENVNGKTHKLITYWNYYGDQNGCTTWDSGHADDWEAITVHVVNHELEHVTYWQHNGRYTKSADTIEKDGEHPIVYVGKYSHGNYHDQRSRASADSWTFLTGGYCYYWKDPRGPGETWSPVAQTLDSVGFDDVFPGSTNPNLRSERPHERTVCREDGGQVLAGIIDGTENTCERNPSYLQDETMTLQSLFYLNIYQ